MRKTRLSDSEIFLYMLCPPQRASKEWDAAVSPAEEPDTPVTNSGIWSVGLHRRGRRPVTAESQMGSMPIRIVNPYIYSGCYGVALLDAKIRGLSGCKKCTLQRKRSRIGLADLRKKPCAINK